MPIEHIVKKGESILSIADKYGLLSDSVWNDPTNSKVRSKRQYPDRLTPGDILYIREKEIKEESGATEQRHRFRRKSNVGLVIRLDIDPNDSEGHDNCFVLSSTDGSYRSEKTVKDDLVPGDDYIDLFFSGLKETKSYTLEVVPPDEEAAQVVFENVPYSELAGLSPRVGSENTPGDTLSEDGEAPYYDDSDEDEEKKSKGT
jgi:hypothetical protein